MIVPRACPANLAALKVKIQHVRREYSLCVCSDAFNTPLWHSRTTALLISRQGLVYVLSDCMPLAAQKQSRFSNFSLLQVLRSPICMRKIHCEDQSAQGMLHCPT
jgi:hypothetical protein